MKIRILSNDTQEAQDFASILAQMYAKLGGNGEVAPIENGREVELDGDFDLENEYGIHRMVRVSPFDVQGRRHTSFVSVEIDGKRRNDQVCSYIFHPYTLAKNHLIGIETEDVKSVFDGRPLGLNRV